MPTTQVADVVVPEIYDPYVSNKTTEKHRLIDSGMIVRDAAMDDKLEGGGLTFNAPSFNDLSNDEENIQSDDPDQTPEHKKRTSATEISVRLQRHQSWAEMKLAGALAGKNPLENVGDLVASYWKRRSQFAAMACIVGVFKDNDLAPDLDGTHIQKDMTVDVSGGAYSAGVTDFSSSAYIDTTVTMGDSKDMLGTIFVHSIVEARMRKNNLIKDVVVDTEGKQTISIYQNSVVVIDDSLPNPAGAGPLQTPAGVFHTYVFGNACMRWGITPDAKPSETDWDPNAGNGGGQTMLHSRVVWSFHPSGYAYIGPTDVVGGPSNANLAAGTSWKRVFPERKQIKMARLITREY